MKKKISEIIRFLTYDIWRITDNEVTHVKFVLYNIIKTIYLCIDRFVEDRIVAKASALTYSTLLAIVPIAAIVFAIARGFGFATIVEQQFYDSMSGNTETAKAIVSFVDSYLAEAKSGVFIGVGLVMLLWTVINLINNIEITFNRIWGIKKARTWYRMVTDYFSMLLLTPILIVLSAGISIFMTTTIKHTEDYVLLAPVLKFLIRLIPYLLTWFMFTCLYMFMPNTRVKFKYALLGGVLAGTVYQAFQYLYIDGQIWVSRYNAIYGSFAALPMFLLWLQMSWTICLFGASLTFAGQNIQNYSFDKDTRNISRRYKDFITVLIMSLIAKRFVKGEPAYSAEEISLENHIPIRLTRQTLDTLCAIEFVTETPAEKKSEEVRYQPAFDVNSMNVALLFERIDKYGSENFKIDKEEEFSDEWKLLNSFRNEYYDRTSKILLKDL